MSNHASAYLSSGDTQQTTVRLLWHHADGDLVKPRCWLELHEVDLVYRSTQTSYVQRITVNYSYKEKCPTELLLKWQTTLY